MSDEEVIKMAKEAGLGFSTLPDDYCEATSLPAGTINIIGDVEVEQIERFAALVAAHEREQCAKVVESAMPLGKILDTAAAIRARGLK